MIEILSLLGQGTLILFAMAMISAIIFLLLSEWDDWE